MSQHLSEEWRIAEAVLRHAHRPVLLWGPPATGKTYAAQTIGADSSRVLNVYLDEESAAFDVVGHPGILNGETTWVEGWGIRAWREGLILVCNEIDKASPSARSALYLIADDPESASWTHPVTGERVTPADGFAIRATSNVAPEDMADADGLRSRFAVQLKISDPHPAAIARLPEAWRDLAAALCAESTPEGRRTDLRAWYSFVDLCESLSEDDAGTAAFSDLWPAIRDARTVTEIHEEG